MDDYVVKIYVHIDERAISFLVIVLLQVKYEMVDVKTSNHWYAIPASVTWSTHIPYNSIESVFMNIHLNKKWFKAKHIAALLDTTQQLVIRYIKTYTNN
jgi:hypothetical protein